MSDLVCQVNRIHGCMFENVIGYHSLICCYYECVLFQFITMAKILEGILINCVDIVNGGIVLSFSMGMI